VIKCIQQSFQVLTSFSRLKPFEKKKELELVFFKLNREKWLFLFLKFLFNIIYPPILTLLPTFKKIIQAKLYKNFSCNK